MKDDIAFSTGKCVLGTVLVARTQRGICALLLGDDAGELARELRERFPCATLREADAELEGLLSRAASFIARPAAGLDVPLDPRGSALEQRVWAALREIPAGTTATYGEIAACVGASAKEVGEACAANVLAVAIPCHRVLRKGGGLAGYRWGIRRKRALLEQEGALADLFHG